MRKNRSNNGYIGIDSNTPYEGSMAPSNVNRELLYVGGLINNLGTYSTPTDGGGYGATANVVLGTTSELIAVYSADPYSGGTAYTANSLFYVSGGGGPTAWGVIGSVDSTGKIETANIYRKIASFTIEDPGRGFTRTGTPDISGAIVSPSFTASIDGTTLNVTAVTQGPIVPGSRINTFPVADGTIITGLGTGRGGTGTYTISVSQTVTSRSMTCLTTAQAVNTITDGVLTGVSLTFPGLFSSGTILFSYLNAGTPEQFGAVTANLEKLEYSSTPTVTVFPPTIGSTAAGASLTPLLLYRVESIGVSSGGQNYTSAPTISFRGSDKISATAVLSGGTVSQIIGVTSAGSFTYSPTVTVGGWSELPSVTEGEDKFVGSYAIYDRDNYVAFVAGQTYNVDWGDGTTGTFNNGATATKIYTSSTFAGITQNPVVDGYKTVVITITPVSGGRLTTLNFNVRHPSLSSSSLSSNWLSMRMAGSTLSTLSICTSISNIRHRMLERFEFVGPSNITSTSSMFSTHAPALKIFEGKDLTINSTNCSSMFAGCFSLRQVGEMNISKATSLLSMFQDCYHLETAPKMNTSSVQSMSTMFQNCGMLKNVPLYDTSNVTNMSSMFSGCRRLSAVPMFDTGKCSSFASTFSTCTSLKTVPRFDTKKANSMASMFSSCSKLEEVPLFNTVFVTDMSSMFSSCTSLEEVPLFNTANVTTMGSMFLGCFNLKRVPQFNTKNVLTISNMFQNCSTLIEVPTFDFSRVTTTGSMFNGCSSLIEYGEINAPNVIVADGMFSNCSRLVKIGTFYMPRCCTFSSLFSSCVVLETPPEIVTMGSATSQTSPIPSFSSMFSSCTTLKYLPKFNVSISTANKAVSYASMFSSASRITEIPDYDFIGVTGSNNTGSLNAIFASCPMVSRIRARNFCQSFSLPNPNMMGATALNELYTNLAVVGASGANAKTLTVTGSLGTASDDISIATSKGWAVTG